MNLNKYVKICKALGVGNAFKCQLPFPCVAHIPYARLSLRSDDLIGPNELNE